MRARPVIGGVFIKMLEDPATWKKWAGRDRLRLGDYAPRRPRRRSPSWCRRPSERPVAWRYTFQRPADDWTQPGFDDSRWKQGPGGFGTAGTPGHQVDTTWNTPDIWMRREVTLPRVDRRLPPPAPHLSRRGDRGLHRRHPRGQGVGLRHDLPAGGDPRGRSRAAQARREGRPGRTLPSDGRRAGSGRRAGRCG